MRLKRTAIAFAMIVAVAVAVVVVNPGGWRTRILTRVFRTYNPPAVISPPPGFMPQVPPGFTVSVFARGLKEPRWLAVAPNGDVFVSNSSAGQVVVLPAGNLENGLPSREVFAESLNLPFGIAFHDDYVYIASTNEVVRLRYDPRTSKRLGPAERVMELPGLGYNQHWTRSIAFSADRKHLFASIGSKTNISIESDPRRAAVVVADPDGSNSRIYATGLRNAVGLAINPQTGDLWATVNERDNLGDDVPDDFLTRVIDGGFYGWPYSYLGGHVDDRVANRPDLVARAIVPDLVLGAHVAPLQFAFYEGHQFPDSYRLGAFISEHGSWNRRRRARYQVLFVPFRDGRPAGNPRPFLTGFVADAAGSNVYGRVVGVATLPDGSLLVSDDGTGTIWRIGHVS